MNYPKNPIGLGYALTSRLHDALLWCTDPGFVEKNKVALVGLLNRLIHEAEYLDGLLTPDPKKQSHLDRVSGARLAQKQFNQVEDSPLPESPE